MEHERQKLQAYLDSQKTQLERNRLGQFSTPIALANEILQFGVSLISDQSISFLDPAIGTGAFYSALAQKSKSKNIEKALGFDIDPFYATPSKKLWENSNLEIEIADFTQQKTSSKFNLVICNPPYVRHHHIANDEKIRLQQIVLSETGIKLSGLAGLYTYFMLLCHKWMDENAISGWLIPSEFMDVNYGVALKKYLLKKVTLLHIHRFDPADVQFSDALVSSAIVWFKNSPPLERQNIQFTYGGSLSKPKVSKWISSSELEKENKWTRFPLAENREINSLPSIGDFFEIKRGLATGSNDFFILSEQEMIARNLPVNLFRPILPGPRYIKENLIKADTDDLPQTERKLYLLDTSLPAEVIKDMYPTLWSYLEEGIEQGVNTGYICSHRTPWYSQERRIAAPIVCTYMGRSLVPDKHPFRFILNNSKATMTNVYLGMYPKRSLLNLLAKNSGLLKMVWEKLNEISVEDILSEGRVYGGGLHKLEPKELAKVSMPFIKELFHQKPSRQVALAFHDSDGK